MTKYFLASIGFVAIIVGAIYFAHRSEGVVPPTTLPPQPVVVTPTVLPYGATTLALGQTATFADITITPKALIEDSRCPMGVYCIQAGTVRIQTEVVSVSSSSVQTLTLGKSITLSGITITLAEVTPPKAQQTQIANSDYRLVFEVDRKAVPPTPPVTTAKCYVGGCSKEICSSDPNVISTCIYQESYACYKTSTCELQANGQCGWTQTPALKMCLAQSASSGSAGIQ